MFGCGSTNLARLANHLDQVHDMDTKERAKWLAWGKMGVCVPRQNVNISNAPSIEETLKNLLKRQKEMETNFYMYLKAGKDANKRRKVNNKDGTHIKWISS